MSKRQQQINDYERRIYEQNERIARLEGQIQTPAREPQRLASVQPPAQRAPAPEKFPSITEWGQQNPDKTLDDYLDARDGWREQQVQTRTEQQEITAAQQQRVESFVGKLNEARAADPEFVQKLSPRVRDNLKPFEALAPGEASGPINVIGAQVYDSPVAPAVLLHFSQHPEALAALEAIPPSIAMLPPSVRVRAHIQHIIREFGKLEGRLAGDPAHPSPAAAAAPSSSISKAPPPPPVLTRAGTTGDPKASAYARKDVDAILAIRAQERRAKYGDA